MFDFDTPFSNPIELLKLAGVLFLLGFIILITVIVFLKGYQIGPQYMRVNLSFSTFSLMLLGMSLGMVLFALLLMPDYAIINLDSERWEMFLTLGTIAFISSLIAVTFVTYSKRGGY